MRTEELLRSIWQGAVEPMHSSENAWFAGAFAEIIPARSLCLTISRNINRPIVLAEHVELEAALPLGDVLAEEVGVDVAYRSLIVMVPKRQPTADGFDRSRDLGAAVGDALLYAADHCALAVEQQTDMIYVLAHSAARLAASRALSRRSVDPRAFCIGLSQSLKAFWQANNACAISDSYFSKADFLWQPQFRDFLHRLDPGFSCPNHVAIPGDLLRLSDGEIGLDDWVKRVEAAARTVIGTPAAATLPRVSGITSRFNLQ